MDDMQRIMIEATERMDDFYFKTMQPYCEDVLEMKISKKDLRDALALWEKDKDKEKQEPETITQIIEDVCNDICKDVCRYTYLNPPTGKDDDWLTEDDDSPCNVCPLNRLRGYHERL